MQSKLIERLFARFSGMYGSKFADLWRGCDLSSVKSVWIEDLSGFSVAELTAGVEACKTRTFPPTLPEFVSLCRPAIDLRTEWTEACEQMRIRLQGKQEDRWSRAQVYHAAVAIGWHDLNSMSWEQIKTRWGNAIANAKASEIPEYRAQLPSPGKQSISREDAEHRVRELGAKLNTAKQDSKAWAKRILKNPESFPSISVQFAQEALLAGAA